MKLRDRIDWYNTPKIKNKKIYLKIRLYNQKIKISKYWNTLFYKLFFYIIFKRSKNIYIYIYTYNKRIYNNM